MKTFFKLFFYCLFCCLTLSLASGCGKAGPMIVATIFKIAGEVEKNNREETDKFQDIEKILADAQAKRSALVDKFLSLVTELENSENLEDQIQVAQKIQVIQEDVEQLVANSDLKAEEKEAIRKTLGVAKGLSQTAKWYPLVEELENSENLGDKLHALKELQAFQKDFEELEELVADLDTDGDVTETLQYFLAVLKQVTNLQKIAENINMIEFASFSPDGRKIVTADAFYHVRIWDAETGKELQTLKGHKVGSVVAFSWDEKRIVTAEHNGGVRIWDTESGKELQKLEGHTDDVNSAAFSLDGTKIVTASKDETVRIWGVATGKELQKLEGHTDDVNSAAFSPDGTKIVTASDDETARIWDAATGKELQKLEGHETIVNSAAFSPDGKKVVLTSIGARIWDVESGEELLKLEGHEGIVLSVAFSPDGRKIVTAGFDETARIWDATTGKELQKLEGHTFYVHSATFSPDGKKVVTASYDETARIWDVDSGMELQIMVDHTPYFFSAVFSPNGKQVVTAGRSNTAQIFDIESGKELQKLEGHVGIIWLAAFSPDGKKAVTASLDGTARIWDTVTGKELQILEGHKWFVTSADFSPDGKKVVTASADGTARIWDADSGMELQSFKGHGNLAGHAEKDILSYATFSPDGTKIVTAGVDKTARIWDAATGKELQKLEGHTDYVNHVAFSPDGTKIVTASDDETVQIWNVATGKELQKLEGHTDGVCSAAFSPDGSKIVTASKDETVRIWNVATGKELQKLEGHTDTVNSAYFSPDGTKIVTASLDATIRIWEVATGKELQSVVAQTTLHAESKPVQSVLVANPESLYKIAEKIATLTGNLDEFQDWMLPYQKMTGINPNNPLVFVLFADGDSLLFLPIIDLDEVDLPGIENLFVLAEKVNDDKYQVNTSSWSLTLTQKKDYLVVSSEFFDMEIPDDPAKFIEGMEEFSFGIRLGYNNANISAEEMSLPLKFLCLITMQDEVFEQTVPHVDSFTEILDGFIGSEDEECHSVTLGISMEPSTGDSNFHCMGYSLGNDGTLALGISLADDKTAEDLGVAFLNFLEETTPNEERFEKLLENISLNYTIFDGFRMSKFEFPLEDFDKTVYAYWGLREDAFVLFGGFDTKSEDRLKTAITAMKSPVDKPNEMLKFSLNQLGSLLENFQNDQQTDAVVIQALLDAGDDANITMSCTYKNDDTQDIQLFISGKIWQIIANVVQRQQSANE